jgi:hypothetical protein
MEQKALNGYLLSMLIVVTGCLTLAQQANATDEPVDDNSPANVAKQLSNPVADLVSVPIKREWDTGIGPEDADRTTYIVQPVIPIELNDEWNIISRTIVTVYVDAESPVEGGNDETGMGDTLQSFFFSPRKPTASGLVWGVGPVFALPTGDDGVTSDKTSVGPTVVLLKQTGGWTLGFLGNHLWDIAGDDDAEDVNLTFMQPFLAYTTKTQTTFSLNTESFYNHEADSGDEWTVPINVTAGQIVKLGDQLTQFTVGYRYYAETPSGGPDYGIKLQMTLLYPKL